MKRLAVFVIAACFGAVSHGQTCEFTSELIQKNLALNWIEFDQTLHQGHRALTEQGCLLEAAILIDLYQSRHARKLSKNQQQVLSWHAGQIYAQGGFNDVAVKRMLGAIWSPDQEIPDLGWNDYLFATVAFLQNDKPTLLRHRDQLAASPATDGNRINLRIVDGLVACFGRPYRVAYGCPSR